MRLSKIILNQRFAVLVVVLFSLLAFVSVIAMETAVPKANVQNQQNAEEAYEAGLELSDPKNPKYITQATK